MPRSIEVKSKSIGKVLGMLTVVESTPYKKINEKIYIVQCECGNRALMTVSQARSSMSCGCKTKRPSYIFIYNKDGVVNEPIYRKDVR